MRACREWGVGMVVTITLTNGEIRKYNSDYVEISSNDIVCLFDCQPYKVEDVKKVEVIINGDKE